MQSRLLAVRSKFLNEARAVAQESLGVARRIDEAQVIAWDVLLLAAIALNTGNVDAAVRLNAALVSLCETTGVHLSDTEAALHGETIGQLSALIGREAYAAALAEVGGLELSEIVHYAASFRL